MNRRGLFAAFALSPFIAINAIAKPKPEGEPHDKETVMMLFPSKETPRPSHPKFIQMAEVDADRTLSMAVGRDGNLWLKTAQGQWKRVMTE
jgi:hypothetical protein